MALFAVTLNDDTTDIIEDADAYQQEGPLTTFYQCREGRTIIDSWSTRLASYRTASVVAIRRARANPVTPSADVVGTEWAGESAGLAFTVS